MLADEFDRVHSVHRALRVGALHDIIPPAQLHPYLISSQVGQKGGRQPTHPVPDHWIAAEPSSQSDFKLQGVGKRIRI